MDLVGWSGACSLLRKARLLRPGRGPICCPMDQMLTVPWPGTQQEAASRATAHSFSVAAVQRAAVYFWLVFAEKSEPKRASVVMFWVV